MKNFWKSRGFSIIAVLIVTAFTAYTLLDTFVIPHSYAVADLPQTSEEGSVSTEAAQAGTSAENTTEKTVSADKKVRTGRSKNKEQSESTAESTAQTTDTDTVSSASVVSSANTYSSGGISITLNEYRVQGTTVYAADVQLSSSAFLKTAFAENTYGRNVTAATSEIASQAGAVLAINGDFYGARTSGYVIRNGVLYRDKASGSEDLVIYADGSFEIVNENEVSAQELLEAGAVQVLSFGPGLVENGEITVDENDEVGRSKASNPRTAIGIIGENHYVFVVSDGRTDESEGLSLHELAEFMQSLGVSTAYNLDGGGSSTMVFNGNVINNPTTGGSRIKERSVSDIVCIG